MRTWAWQIAPPLLLLWPASTTHGPSAYYLRGFLTLLALISVCRALYLLFHPEKPYLKLIRPSLTLLIAGLALIYIHGSLKPVRAFMNETATRIQAECNQQGQCPKALQGWSVRKDRYSSQIMNGSWIKWPVLYHTDGKNFELRLYKLLDDAEYISGGVSTPLQLLPNSITRD